MCHINAFYPSSVYSMFVYVCMYVFISNCVMPSQRAHNDRARSPEHLRSDQRVPALRQMYGLSSLLYGSQSLRLLRRCQHSYESSKDAYDSLVYSSIGLFCDQCVTFPSFAIVAVVSGGSSGSNSGGSSSRSGSSSSGGSSSSRSGGSSSGGGSSGSSISE